MIQLFNVIMFLITAICKLADVGNIGEYSWWWITAPLWVGFILEVIVRFYLSYLKVKEKEKADTIRCINICIDTLHEGEPLATWEEVKPIMKSFRHGIRASDLAFIIIERRLKR